nr:MAG TPA: hypothetical protein [Caudoviricetes sp.]DAW82190.1 MAG TPA: hypothetical protein [Caudoviricetes sp.]
MSLLTEFVDIFGNPVYILKSLLTKFVDKKSQYLQYFQKFVYILKKSLLTPQSQYL